VPTGSEVQLMLTATASPASSKRWGRWNDDDHRRFPSRDVRLHTDLHAAADKRLVILHEQGHTEAQLYGRDESVYGGLNAFFLLMDKPEVYGLPNAANAKLPSRNDLGGYLGTLAAAAAALLGGLIAFRRRREAGPGMPSAERQEETEATPVGKSEDGAGREFHAAARWRWYFLACFFLAGLAGGCYTLGRVPRLWGGAEYEQVGRVCFLLTLPLVIVCPILLTLDLGRPVRFWHMMADTGVEGPGLNFRYWSPMSLLKTAWSISGVAHRAG
jgi:hypothetical protein